MRNQLFTSPCDPPVNLGGLTVPSRRDRTVRAVAAEWRRLTSPGKSRNGPGGQTLIACSGGGDSSALVIALAAAAGRSAMQALTVAHIVHDLRAPREADADRDRAEELAATLGLPFVAASVAVKSLPGNAEANARRARYAALTEIASARGIRWIATAHNSHDLAESVIMALLRGAGPRGIAGIAPSRRLAHGVRLVRPMLVISPGEARALCGQAGWVFAHDATNDDRSRLRNAVRAEILPRLLALRPGAERRIASAALRCKQAADTVTLRAVRANATAQTSGGFAWRREQLRALGPAVVGEALRRAAAALAGPRVLDRLPARTIDSAVRLIRSRQTDPKVLQWSGVVVNVDAHTVNLAAR
ncbi:MAG: tRNA lysidine(34) synthetase TilS [Phycisphaerales bacterium]|nr:tRNA lysidine(34) synthetase TilS [Phycisphaerales bacterium]